MGIRMGDTCTRSSVRLLASSSSDVSHLLNFRINDDYFVFYAMFAREKFLRRK